ncbi:MAG TPA: Uma2 family endonuclease [Thermoanaerobaculia bacterium]|jgi:Uma2 family endonuclease
MAAVTSSSPAPLTLQLGPTVRLDDDQLFEICSRNPELRVERTATGELILMPPAGGKTSDRNSEITTQLGLWTRRNKTGRAFDSSGGFTLPNGAMRSPDAAWVELERLRELTSTQKERFLPLVPTFVIELRSPSDTLSTVEAKLDEYVDNGVRLGWLIDPVRKRLHVYRPQAAVEILDKPATISGDPELAGFVLELAEIWDPAW